MSRFNCKFVEKSVDRIFDAVCVNYVSPIFKVILATAIASVSMFFASFFSFCLAIRYARKVRPSKVFLGNKKNKKNLQKDRVRGVKKEKTIAKVDKKDSLNKKANPKKKSTVKKPSGKKVKKPTAN
mmetsp:Transcript_4333/g.663  ORF Transcript_4333/g.663 Transcript_4333/m.663 type:complete len:126 (-) Transcript_4333:330-707(-)